MSIEQVFHKVRPGTIIISNRDAEKSSFLRISDDGVKLSNNLGIHGIEVGKDGVSIQGDLLMTSKGTSIKKGEYSENPNSAKIFTYTETIAPESMIKEVLSEVAGRVGINIKDLTKQGILPLLTDVPIGAGSILPHTHMMLFKHTHRIEPAYLYRVPAIVKLFTGSLKPIFDFFKTFGS